MVLAIAALVGYLGMRMATHGAIIETAGTWISIVVLLAIAAINVRQLRSNTNDRLFGIKSRMLPRALREATSPWVAVPIGLLFGFGFETSSQIAAYAVAFAADAGVAGALLVGSMFCVGMVCTDTLDSLFIHRLVSYKSGALPRVMRVWIWSVTLFAVVVAGYEFAQLVGWKPPFADIDVSIVLVSALLAVFAWIFLVTRRANQVEAAIQYGGTTR